jgi:hypothetical protein
MVNFGVKPAHYYSQMWRQKSARHFVDILSSQCFCCHTLVDWARKVLFSGSQELDLSSSHKVLCLVKLKNCSMYKVC